MSRSQVAFFGIAGMVGAALLVTPLVNWSGPATPSDPPNGYDPLLSEASCAEVDTQLALAHRPPPAPAEVQEVAFLEGIQPSGGEEKGPATGTDAGVVPASFTTFYGPTKFSPPKPPQPWRFKGLPSFHGPVVGPAGNPFPTLRSSKTLPPRGAGFTSPESGGGNTNDEEEDDIVDLKDDESSKSTIVTLLPPPPENEQTTLTNGQPATAVPEPASFGLLALGVGLLATRRRRPA